MDDDKTKLAMYVLDRALVVVVLFGIYQFVQSLGGRWVASQEGLTSAIVTNAEDDRTRWLSWVQNQESFLANQEEYLTNQKETSVMLLELLDRMQENRR